MMPPSSRQATNGWATTYVCPLKLAERETGQFDVIELI
jgi:hypothetical protein